MTIDCDNCGGEGSIKCSTCEDGEGEVDCPVCEGGSKRPYCQHCTGLIRLIDGDKDDF